MEMLVAKTASDGPEMQTHTAWAEGKEELGAEVPTPRPDLEATVRSLVPSTFFDFFAASAGVAGALIGLLFVALSVAPAASDPEKRLELDVRAGVAFSALTDALVVALFALIPGIDLGVPALVTALVGIASCIALGIVLWQTADVPDRGRQLRMLGIQSLVFVYQFSVALRLVSNAHDQSAVKTLAVLTVVFFLVGIARAWQLIGARDTGLFRVVREAIHQRSALPKGPEAGNGRRID